MYIICTEKVCGKIEELIYHGKLKWQLSSGAMSAEANKFLKTWMDELLRSRRCSFIFKNFAGQFRAELKKEFPNTYAFVYHHTLNEYHTPPYTEPVMQENDQDASDKEINFPKYLPFLNKNKLPKTHLSIFFTKNQND